MRKLLLEVLEAATTDFEYELQNVSDKHSVK